MHGNMSALVVIAAFLLCGVNAAGYSQWETQCMDYYATDENYNLDELPAQMYVVYYWPPNQRQRDTCEFINFKKLTHEETAEARFQCGNLTLPSNETVMKASYINNRGKHVNLLFYGQDEVKEMYRACDKNISKYIFKKVNDNYILGINCSAGGRGMLFSRFMASSTEVHSVVENIGIMSGREGSPDCPLPNY
ncbi:uncharacterized protein LOC142979809 [Anticarsia gemmatalis]|uniref:uncharacterized protein LOC142979809 n=1 Tax=Anticarsia gemmatalis TaxID=129554 RepID=UPI003F758EC2